MNTKELFYEAQRHLVQTRYKESVEAFTKALEAGSEPVMTHLSRGVAYLKMEDSDNALADFTKAVEMDNGNFRAYYYRGMVQMIKNDYSSAVKDFTYALKIKPDLATAMFARGTAYAQLDMIDESMADIKATIPYMEANAQAFSDTYGLIQTQFDKVMAQISGASKSSASIELTESEKNSLRKWLDEEGS